MVLCLERELLQAPVFGSVPLILGQIKEAAGQRRSACITNVDMVKAGRDSKERRAQVRYSIKGRIVKAGAGTVKPRSNKAAIAREFSVEKMDASLKCGTVEREAILQPCITEEQIST